MGLCLLFDEFSLFEGFKVIFVDLLDFALFDEEEEFLVFIEIGLFGFKNEIVFELDDFFFHGVAKTYFKCRTNLFFDIVFGGALKGWEIEDFSFGSALMCV